MDNKMLDIAVQYLKLGLSVIPLNSNKVVEKHFLDQFKNDLRDVFIKETQEGADLNEELQAKLKVDLLVQYAKKPLEKWTPYKEKLATHEVVKEWFTDWWPEANIGIVTGKVSNIFVLDVDGEAGENYIKEQGGLPNTVTVKTGKGRHLYFRYPKNLEIKNSTNVELKLDIRGDGGYVVAPPSIHGSKSLYSWVEGHSLLDHEIAEASQWLLDFASKQNAHQKKKKSKTSAEPKKADGEIIFDDPDFLKTVDLSEINNSILTLIENGSAEGCRNDSAAKVVGHWLRIGIGDDETWQLLKMWNTKNQPPLAEDELATVFDSIAASEDAKSFKIDTSKFRVSVEDLAAEFNKAESNRIEFAQDNLCELEKQMDGGLVGGNLYLLGGVPSSGKTALCNNIADNLCLNGFPVIIFSYDDGGRELQSRSIARFAAIDIEELNLGRLADNNLQKIRTNQQLKDIFQFKHVITETIVVEQWQQFIDDIAGKFGKKPVIFIDYLKKVRTKNRAKEERLRMDAIVNAITDLAKHNDIPIIAISELNCESYKMGYILNMAAFKETGSLEYEASWLGIMAPVEKDSNGQSKIVMNWNNCVVSGQVSLTVLKTKRGTGKTGNIPLSLDMKSMKFSSDILMKVQKKTAASGGFVS